MCSRVCTCLLSTAPIVLRSLLRTLQEACSRSRSAHDLEAEHSRQDFQHAGEDRLRQVGRQGLPDFLTFKVFRNDG
jgi:hypothetical protein